MATKWVCTEYEKNPTYFDPPHVYEEGTDDGFCPGLCPGPGGDVQPFHGILVLKKWPPKPQGAPVVSITFPSDNAVFEKGNQVTISADAEVDEDEIERVEFFVNNRKIGEDTTGPFTYNYTLLEEGDLSIKVTAWATNGKSDTSKVAIKVKNGGPDPFKEVGLCVIMMDASASMLDIAFEGSPLTKMRLIATSAATGIFDLERMLKNPNAFVALYKFDDRVEPIKIQFDDRPEPIFPYTVADLIKHFNRDLKKFAAFIYDELFKMQQGTDINQALAVAHSFVDKFMKKKLPDFPKNNYTPMIQRILKYKSTQAISIPNVRVLIYTDGMQFDTRQSRILHENPFSKEPINGLNHDIVIGAFFGKENDDGCKELKGLLSNCPIHDVEQFFLFDSPDKIGNLKFLFRMASGASGFCPRCLEKELSMYE